MSKKFISRSVERPMTAITYYRVSSIEQVSNFSLGTQEKLCKEFAERKKIEIWREFRDGGKSAKTTSERDGLQELLLYAEKHRGKIGYLIIPRLDRLNRNITDFYILKDKLRRLEVEIMSATEDISESAEGELLEAVIAGVAQFDNTTKSRKTTDGMKARAAAGYWSTSAPIGYVNGVDSFNKKNLIVDPTKAPYIRQLFEDFATGMFTYKELADKYEDKLTSRDNVKLCQQRIPPILRNPVYIARIEKPEWNVSVPAKFPAIVSDELFYKVQSITKGRPVGLKLPRRRLNDDFPLRGIICHHCHRFLTGGWSKGRFGVKYAYYNCPNRECLMRRIHKSIKKKDIEDDFSAFLKRTKPSDEFFVDLREAVRIAYEAEMAGTLRQGSDAEKKIEKLKADKEKIFDLMLEEPEMREGFKAQLIKKDAEIRELEALAKSSQLENCDMDAVMDYCISLIQTLHEEWKNLTARDLGVLIKMFFPKNLEYHYPDIQTAELSIIYRLYRRFELKKECKVPS